MNVWGQLEMQSKQTSEAEGTDLGKAEYISIRPIIAEARLRTPCSKKAEAVFQMHVLLARAGAVMLARVSLHTIDESLSRSQRQRCRSTPAYSLGMPNAL